MNLTDPQQMAQLLKSFGFHTNKDLGQNFLVDDNALSEIIHAADTQEGDKIIEIGPGPGVLTQQLLKSDAKQVKAIEIDEKVLPILKHTTEGSKKLEIVHINALEYQPEESGYILAANIPYYLTSPIFRHYLSHKNKPKRAVVLIQKEVAEKICCKENDQTILSLQIAIYGKAETVAIVPKTSFFPAPKVDSAILKIEMYDKCLISDELLDTFWKITKQAFSLKRKKLSNTLGKKQANKEKTFNDIFAEIGIDGDRRAQTLTIEEWRSICECIQK